MILALPCRRTAGLSRGWAALWCGLDRALQAGSPHSADIRSRPLPRRSQQSPAAIHYKTSCGLIFLFGLVLDYFYEVGSVLILHSPDTRRSTTKFIVSEWWWVVTFYRKLYCFASVIFLKYSVKVHQHLGWPHWWDWCKLYCITCVQKIPKYVY